MEIRAEEITKVLKQQLAGFSAGTDTAEIGTVLSVGDGIARIHGLTNCMAGELLDLPHGVRDGTVDDALVRGFALQPGQDLGVVDPLAVEILGQDHGRSDERSGERTAARLVHAGDPREPLLAQGALVAVEVGPQCSHPARDGGQMITKACPITRSTGI